MDSADSRPQRKNKKKATVDSFVGTTKYGEAARDDSDLDEEERDYMQGLDATPRTKRHILQDEKASDIKKLGPWATAFTLFKGFVATGILYMPKNFVNGGWLFSVIALIGALFLTLFCIKLLLEVRDKIGGSFSEIGAKTYGKCGKLMVDTTLFGSQVGFVTAYVYFIASQTIGVIDSAFDVELAAKVKWYFFPICFGIFYPLVLIRKIETFAKFHIFGDAMIIITIIVICIYAGI